tara:strand:- start:2966 stop:3823 length:858 start_codon:yes stop_codon:yes gene_type:complete
MNREELIKQVPSYDKLFQPVLDAIKELGGSASPSEVRDLLVEKIGIPEEVLELTIKNGTEVFLNRCNWARLYLKKAGYLDTSTRGIWSLTEKGRTKTIDDSKRKEIVRQVAEESRKRKKTKSQSDEPENDNADHREQLISIMRDLSPSGFERMCQRLLRESGFEQVVVTGRSGDGGIDGTGVLQINAFVAFRVLFQCKRYQGSVGSGAVRDFRGAMQGRADKGIIITTGTFTADAKKESSREGVEPIELVNGDSLIDLFESLELGLTPRKAFDVNSEFFDQFQDD